MKIKKNTLVLFVISIVVLGVFYFALGSGGSSTGNVVNGEVQNVVIGMNNWKYNPQVIKVKAGVPVSISLDSSVQGCFRDLMIPELKLSKYMGSTKDTLVFTLDKGSYTYACSMFMGSGTIIAE